MVEKPRDLTPFPQKNLEDIIGKIFSVKLKHFICNCRGKILIVCGWRTGGK